MTSLIVQLKKKVNNRPGFVKVWKAYNKLKNLRIVVDTPPRRINHKYKESEVGYPCDLDREEISRELIFSKPGNNLNFLDVGGRDGELKYMLGINKEKGDFDLEYLVENQKKFHAKYNYYGLDIDSKSDNVLVGDICNDNFIDEHSEHINNFDIIYSNNTFEHLERPWVAIENIYAMLKTGGICIIIAPFSWRYHEVPGDYFRFSHTAIPSMFKNVGAVDTIISGYDLRHRRDFNQGSGKANDLVPTDNFGAWRESWQMITVVKKIGA